MHRKKSSLLFLGALIVFYPITLWLAWNAANAQYKITDPIRTMWIIGILLFALYTAFFFLAKKIQELNKKQTSLLMVKSIFACFITFLVVLPVLFFVTTTLTDQISRTPTYSPGTDRKGSFVDENGAFICRWYRHCQILEGCNRGFTYACNGTAFAENKTVYSISTYGETITKTIFWIDIGTVVFFEDPRMLFILLSLVYPFLIFFLFLPQIRLYASKK